MIVRRDLFGGRGEVSVLDLCDGRTPTPPFSAALACTLEPGGRVGEHLQEHDAEIVIGLDGDGWVEVDGTGQPFGAAALVSLPLGSTLAIENRGDTPLSYLIIKARPPLARDSR